MRLTIQTEQHQRSTSLFNRVRCWFSFDEWERVRCHDCREERLVRQNPALDRDAPAQECGGCGSPSLFPVDRQSSAAYCPGCGHDVLHQQESTVDRLEETGSYHITCQYCGTTSGWHLGAPVPLRVPIEEDDA